MAPSEMKALALGQRSWLSIIWNGLRGKGVSHGASIKTIPAPTIGPSEILVKVYSVACNPTDVGHIDFIGPANSIIGCDYSGIVFEIGTEVDAKYGWKIGDRIAGVVHGGLYPSKGAFAEYLKVPYDLAWKPPKEMGHREAATYGISAVTAMQGLYTKLDVPWPDDGEVEDGKRKGKTILIYAGSTSASLFAIQLAKLAGYTVITTCSEHNFSLVKSYGADMVYDYHSPTALSEILNEYPGIDRAFDGISLKQSTLFCTKVVEKSKGKVVVLLDTIKAGKREGVKVEWILMYTLFGEEFNLLGWLRWGVVEGDRDALVRFYEMLGGGLWKRVKPPPVEVIGGGFDGLFESLELLRAKKVSGRRVVVDFV